MKIVFVINSLIYGGAETQVIAMSRELARRGHSIAIYTLSDTNPRAEELDGSGVKLIVDRKRSKLDFRLISRLRRHCMASRPDIVQSFLYDSDVYSRIALVGTGIVVLNSERSDNYSLNLFQQIGHVLTRELAAGVIANSYSGASFAQRLFKFPSERIHVVWNGIDAESIRRRIASKKTHMDRLTFLGDPELKIACLVGAIKPQKDYLFALKCAKKLVTEHPNWRVLFLGDQLHDTSEYKIEVMSEFSRQGGDERIKFLGLRHDAVEIMSECDVLFSTSLNEGFPNVVLEAMAAEVPVASTDYSDIRRILPFSWQVIGERSAEELVCAILRVDLERDRVIPAQLEWIEKFGTIGACVGALESVYRGYARGSTGVRIAADPGTGSKQ
jgi:glycosyltransferase involved in cell wall biosynthesis